MIINTPYGPYWISKDDESRDALIPSNRGLGDTVASIVKRMKVKPCKGCDKRRRKLNELFPYRK